MLSHTHVNKVDDTDVVTDDTDVVESIELGMDIAKEFFDESSGKSLGLFRGHIFDIDEDELDGTVLYHIIYEDGDAEDMTESECRDCIEFYGKLESGEIKEWEIGGNE